MWDVEALLEDTKTYSFANHDRAGIVSGEPIHRMHIRLTVDDAFVVQAAEASTEAAPFSICGAIEPAFAGLVGLRIGPGWRKAVLQRMARVHGCTHLTDLLIGPVTQTVMQTVGPARSRRQTAGRSGAKPSVIDTCHAGTRERFDGSGARALQEIAEHRHQRRSAGPPPTLLADNPFANAT